VSQGRAVKANHKVKAGAEVEGTTTTTEAVTSIATEDTETTVESNMLRIMISTPETISLVIITTKC